MHPQLSCNSARRTRQAQQEGGENPIWQRALALVKQCMGEVVEGPLAAVTPVALTPWPIVVVPPRIDLQTLAPGALEGPLFPAQRMDVGVTLVDVEELMDVQQFLATS